MAIETRILKNGVKSYKVTWYKMDGVTQLSKTFRNAKKAAAFEAEKREQKKSGVDFDEKSALTLKAIAERWLELRTQGKSDDTVQGYQAFVERIKKKFGDTKGFAITSESLQLWIDDIRVSHTPDVAKRMQTRTRALFSFAFRRKLILSDPSVALDPIEVRKLDDRQFPSKKHIWRILKAETGLFEMFFWLLAFTGLRPSEARALRWDNLRYDEQRKSHYLQVEWNADRHGRISKLKSKSARRRIPLGAQLVKKLEEWKEDCPASELGLVFPTDDGKVSTGKRINSRLREMQTLLGVISLVSLNRSGRTLLPGSPLYTPYQFRHFAASILIESGLGPKRIQQILGHSSITLTFDHYGHLFPDSELTTDTMTVLVDDVMAAGENQAAAEALL